MLFFSTLMFSLFSTMALIPILRRYAVRMRCVDEPGERKMHAVPMPRVGGLAMAVGALVPMLLWASKDRMSASILLGGGIIVLFGFLDDMKDLGYRTKFCAQLAAALVVVFFGGIKVCCLGSLLPEGFVLPDIIAIPVTLVIIVGVTNAINLSDGLDGLAGGIMLLCFICIGFLAYRAENHIVALLAVATGGAIFGFLRYNTYPATVFMGDAGSQLLGFLATTMAMTLTQGNTPLSPLFPMVLLGLPILDTLMVMIERVSKGRSPFLADKNHIHHKLLRINFFHREAVVIIYMLQAGLVTVAYLLRFHSDWLLLLVYLGFALSVLLFFLLADRNSWRINRPGFLDRMVKQKLKIHIKDRFVAIKVSQAVVESGLPLLLLATCIIPADIPWFVTVISLVSIVAIGLANIFRPKLIRNILWLLMYLFMPMVIYYGELRPSEWIPHGMLRSYHLCFGLLVLFAIITLKSTRRKDGFTTTPLDFILLFIAIVVPNFPGVVQPSYHLGFIAAKTIVFFFVFEVLVGELRGQQNRLNLAFVIALLILVVKGVV